MKYYCQEYARGLYQGTEIFSKVPTREQFSCIEKLNNGLVNKWCKEFISSSYAGVSPDSLREINNVIRIMGRNAFVEYLIKYSAREFQQYISRKYK